MSRARELIDRYREERRVRRDFDRLMEANGLRLDGPMLDGRPPTTPKPQPVRRRGWRWWTSRFVVLVLAMLVIASALVLTAPFPYEAPVPPQTAFFYDRDGRLIAQVRPGEDRVVVPLRRIPQDVREAVIAAEDERFYRHPGVDVLAIGRAAWKDLTGGRFQGGSTITQQLVRFSSDPELEHGVQGYVGTERTLGRKLQEAITAVRLERRLSKDEILEQYLNLIYFGEGAYGVEAAARTYFGTHVWNLTLAEAAMLAGLPAGPSSFNPRTHHDRARARRDWVLGRMANLGMITEARAARAAAAPLEVLPPKPPVTKAAYFVDYVTRDLRQRYGDDLLYRGGIRVDTTLDMGLQRAAEDSIAGVLDEPGDPSASLVAIDVRTGGILAMVGGRNFKRSEVNLATGQGGSGRQAGSAFKPFVLATALEEGISQYRVYPAPGSTTIGDWSVSNYSGGSYGSLSVRSATINSVNTVYAQLIMDVGPADVVRQAHRMGIHSFLHADGPLTLGTSEVTPLEMTAGYATLAAGGIARPPTGVARLVTGDGEVVEELDAGGKRAVSEDTADLVTDILQDAVAYGTGRAAAIPGTAVAGKTGTAEEHADAWFCGYTTRVATCVWVGYPEGRVPMTNVHGISVTGGSLPAAIWRAFMLHAPVGGTFDEPSGAGGVPSSGSSVPTATDEGADDPVTEEPAEPPPAEPSPSPTPTDDNRIIPQILPSPSPG
ncbi:MAG: transglycosylase domain-containing protein [Actinomycetota bacterium]